MTNFYTINYGSELLDGGKLGNPSVLKCAAPSGQNDTMEEVKMKRSLVQNDSMSSGQNGLMILQRIQQRLLQRIKDFSSGSFNRTRRRLNRIFNPTP